MRRLLILSFALLALIPARADALTVRDVVELARAGLGDDIILALIEVDRSVFPIDTATLKTLQAAGVGERVILAMIRSQRTQPAVPVADVTDAPEASPAAQPPQVIVIDHHEQRVRQVLVPVYVPVVRRQRHPVQGRNAAGHHRGCQPSASRTGGVGVVCGRCVGPAVCRRYV